MLLLEQIQKDKTRPTRSAKPFNLDNQAFVGMWQNRPEMQDSTACVRQVRNQQWQR